MLKLALAVLLALPLALLGAVVSTGIAVVDVREGGPGGHHLIVPVPLLALQLGLAFVPADALSLDLGHAGADVAEGIGVAREVLEALSEAPDGELVRVEEPGEQVLISKSGELLKIRVHDGTDDVSVNLPIATVLEALPRRGGAIDATSVVGALRNLGHAELLEVHSGPDHVKVSVW